MAMKGDVNGKPIELEVALEEVEKVLLRSIPPV
jgi:hypothetical protein